MSKKGFTLIEMLVVLLIILSVTGTSTFGINKLIEQSKEKKLKELIKDVELATDIYFSKFTVYSHSLLNNEVEEVCTRIYSLQNEGLIDPIIENPVTDELIPANLCVYSRLNSRGVIQHHFDIKEVLN